jgi:putative ABC transport system permease protein
VLPEGFHFMQNADIWRLTYYNGPGAEARRWHNLLLVGRLKPGVTLQQAQSEVDVISRSLEAQYPGTNEGKALLLTRLHDALVENVRASLLMLMGTVLLVLLLACANVAGLLLARGQSRLGEMAIRSAMGASRTRLVRQLLTESILMAALGGVVGTGFALGFQTLLIRLLPMGPIGITRPALDASSLLFALGISFTSGILFGMVPALQGTVVNLSLQLKSGARTTWAHASALLRSGLVVVQVAVSVMLLIGAGLLIRSLSRQMNVELGFDPNHVLTAGVTLPENDYADPVKRIAFFDSLIEEVKALPGVVSAGIVNRLPIRDQSGNIYLYSADQPPDESQVSDMNRSADFRCVTPGYLETMGIPLLTGRDIARTDVEGSPRVMLISKSLANLFFPGQSPLGKRLIVDMGEKVVHEVVGVVGDARLNRVRAEPFHAMYMSYYQVPRSAMRIAIKTASDPAVLVAPLREILRAKSRNIALAEPATMNAILDDAMSDYRIVTSSLGLFSTIALLLAMVGLYGVLAYYVSQRYHDIGVRLALGARPGQVATLVVAHGMGLVVAGLAIGLTGSFWATHLVQQLLFGVEPTDSATFLVVALLCGSVALIACLLPAWRATRVDPVVTLQSS